MDIKIKKKNPSLTETNSIINSKKYPTNSISYVKDTCNLWKNGKSVLFLYTHIQLIWFILKKNYHMIMNTCWTLTLPKNETTLN